MNSERSRVARRALDRRLGELPAVTAFAVPRGGWVKAVRSALGMSAADLAARLQITPASVNDLERSEGEHRIGLGTLERAAAAMSCELVYALIPRGSLTEIVQHQAQTKVEQQVRAVARAMDLEAQTAPVDYELVQEEERRLIASGRLWK